MPDLGPFFPSASLPWLLGAAVLASLGAILVLAGLTALFGLHPLRFVTRTLLGLLLISLGLLEGTITVGIQGYRSLAREELAPRCARRAPRVRASGASLRSAAIRRHAALSRRPDGDLPDLGGRDLRRR